MSEQSSAHHPERVDSRVPAPANPSLDPTLPVPAQAGPPLQPQQDAPVQQVVPAEQQQQAPAPTNITIVNQQGGGGGGFNPAAAAVMGAEDKSPGLALFLGLIFTGAGQLYNGQIGKAAAFFFGAVVLWFVLLGWIVHIVGIVDAYSTAKKKRAQYHMMLAGIGQGGGAQIARTAG